MKQKIVIVYLNKNENACKKMKHKKMMLNCIYISDENNILRNDEILSEEG